MAEVKVKITAANQTQTGFQSVLADAQKTAAQVQQTFARASEGPRMPKTFTPDPSKVGPINIGEAGLEPLRELQRELRQVREASQQAFDPEPPQQFSSGIGGIIGRFALIVGGAATVGKIIASAFDQAGEAIKRSIAIQEQFNRALTQAGQATTFEGAVSGFQQLNALADQTGKTIEETFGRNIGEAVANLFQGRPGQLLANVGNFLTRGAIRGDLEDTQEQQRRIARDTLSGNLAVQQQEREELLGAGGNADAIARIKREQEKRREIEALRATFTDLSQPEQSAEFEKLSQALKEKQATDDLIDAQKRLAAAKDEAAAAGRERSQAGMSSAQRLEQEKAAMQELQAEQAKFAQAASMAGVDPTGGLTEAASRYYELQTQIEQSKQRQVTLEEAIKKETERAAESARRTQERKAQQDQRQQERRDNFNLNTELMQARASGDKRREEEILQQQDFDKAFEATRSFEDASNFAAAAAQLRAQQNQQMTGSFGASSLQRIGFASNEFFDTRRKEDPAKETKRAADVAKQILDILKKGEPLVLPSNS